MVRFPEPLTDKEDLTGACSWYKRSEFGIRAAVFFSAATVSDFG